MRLSRAAEFVGRPIRAAAAAAAARREREVALRCLAQPGIAILCVSPHRAYTIQKYYFS